MEVMIQDPPADPDAQATVTDFLDYTEYLPSDLARSLTLIRKLDGVCIEEAHTVHELTEEYGSLPNSSPDKRPSSHSLRQDISYHLDHAISCREASYGEASRLSEMVDRHYSRLTSILTKLHALPKPPSRDPTPVPRSPQASRKTPPPRITLRLDGARAAKAAGRSPEKDQKRIRSRKITIPGEVLPPPNPDSPIHFTDSDWESIPPSPIPMPTSRVGGSRKPGRIRPPKPPKAPKLKLPKPPRPPRPPGAMGTNVHSAVAGISTSNALSLLSPPPADAKPGSIHAPWMRLTEWEMAKLRKRMKKNAIWTPSETMIRRELSLAGRGPDNYKSTKSKCDVAGEEFIDEDNIANAPRGKPLVPGEISADSLGLADTNLSNRGMALNIAKKEKREKMAREQADILASEAQKLGHRLDSLKNIFAPIPEKTIESPTLSAKLPKAKDSTKKRTAPEEKPSEVTKTPAKKRKREESPKPQPPPKQTDTVNPPVKPSLETVTSPAKPSKKRKTEQTQPEPLRITTKTVTTTVPLAAPAPSPSRPSRRSTSATPATPVMAAPEKPTAATTPRASAASSRPRRISLTLKGPAEPPVEVVHASPRTSSRVHSRRSSAGTTSATTPRDHLRRKSTTPAPPPDPAPIVTSAGRRSKRPAPGPVIESQEGGAAVSVGKRQHAPKKKSGVPVLNAKRAADSASSKEKENAVKAEEEAAGEEIDADEARYCYCGDVSYGDMVACENEMVSPHYLWLQNRFGRLLTLDQCEREWFHFGCVGLKEPPGRRVKWFCPDCKKIVGKK